MNQESILVLETGLFWDMDMLHKALLLVDGTLVIDLCSDNEDAVDWDHVMTQILASNRVIAI